MKQTHKHSFFLSPIWLVAGAILLGVVVYLHNSNSYQAQIHQIDADEESVVTLTGSPAVHIGDGEVVQYEDGNVQVRPSAPTEEDILAATTYAHTFFTEMLRALGLPDTVTYEQFMEAMRQTAEQQVEQQQNTQPNGGYLPYPFGPLIDEKTGKPLVGVFGWPGSQPEPNDSTDQYPYGGMDYEPPEPHPAPPAITPHVNTDPNHDPLDDAFPRPPAPEPTPAPADPPVDASDPWDDILNNPEPTPEPVTPPANSGGGGGFDPLNPAKNLPPVYFHWPFGNPHQNGSSGSQGYGSSQGHQ